MACCAAPGFQSLADCSEKDYDRIFDINTKGVFFALKEAARRVEQFVRALSWELGGRSITVNAISPGPTETEMMQDRYRDKAAGMSPFNRIGDPKTSRRSLSSSPLMRRGG